MAVYCSVEDVSNELQLGPGEWIPLSDDSGSGEANPNRVNIGVDEIMRFPVGATVELAERDVTGELITRIEQATVLTVAPGLVYFTLSANLVDDFNIANNAAVRLVATWDNYTIPRYQDVTRLIEDLEDEIDERTHTTWRQRHTTEWYPFYTKWRSAIYPTPMISGVFGERSTNAAVLFNRRDLKELDETHDTAFTGYPGDSLQIWNGSAYEEWVDSTAPNYIVRTEGRDDDFWINYEAGILYFVKEKPSVTDMAIVIRYRYGRNIFDPLSTEQEGPANRDIQRACKLLCAASLLRGERYQVNFPGGDEAGAEPPEEAAASYNLEVDRILARHTELIGWFGEH